LGHAGDSSTAKSADLQTGMLLRGIPMIEVGTFDMLPKIHLTVNTVSTRGHNRGKLHLVLKVSLYKGTTARVRSLVAIDGGSTSFSYIHSTAS
jgi:hypothetical protein